MEKATVQMWFHLIGDVSELQFFQNTEILTCTLFDSHLISFWIVLTSELFNKTFKYLLAFLQWLHLSFRRENRLAVWFMLTVSQTKRLNW